MPTLSEAAAKIDYELAPWTEDKKFLIEL